MAGLEGWHQLIQQRVQLEAEQKRANERAAQSHSRSAGDEASDNETSAS